MTKFLKRHRVFIFQLIGLGIVFVAAYKWLKTEELEWGLVTLALYFMWKISIIEDDLRMRFKDVDNQLHVMRTKMWINQQ